MLRSEMDSQGELEGFFLSQTLAGLDYGPMELAQLVEEVDAVNARIAEMQAEIDALKDSFRAGGDASFEDVVAQDEEGDEDISVEITVDLDDDAPAEETAEETPEEPAEK